MKSDKNLRISLRLYWETDSELITWIRKRTGRKGSTSELLRNALTMLMDSQRRKTSFQPEVPSRPSTPLPEPKDQPVKEGSANDLLNKITGLF